MKTRDLLVIVATGIIAITVSSTCSPLYRFNNWGDANAIFTVGKSMLHGLVPYRDLFEHKGPLLHMLHAIAALVSFRSFFGVYLIEIIAASVFLYWGYKTIKILDGNASILFIPVLGALVYTSPSFAEGDSVEELMLPLWAFAIFVGLKAVREEGVRVSARDCVWVGTSAAFALWMKFSLLGIFVGWYLFLALMSLRRKDKVDVLRMLGWLVAGALIPTVPILIFFAANNALTDLYEVYFYDNLFEYAEANTNTHLLLVGIINNLMKGLHNLVTRNLLFSALLCAAIVMLYRGCKKRAYLAYLSATAGLAFLLVYIGGHAHKYSSFIFLSFMPWMLVVNGNALKGLCGNNRWISNPLMVLACCLVYLLCMSRNAAQMGNRKCDYPQYVFADIINQKPDATLLEYGVLGGGVYTTTGIVPGCKYFFHPNMCQDMVETAQKEYVDKGLVDFVVTKGDSITSERYAFIADAAYEMPPLHTYWWNVQQVVREMIRIAFGKTREEKYYRLYKLKED